MASSVLLCVSRRLFTEPTSSCSANCACGARARFSASEQTFVAWKTEVVVTQAWRTDRQLRGRLAAWTFELLIAIIEVYRGNNLMILTACLSGCRFCLCPVQAPSASLCSGLLSNVMWCKQTRKNYWVSAVVVIDYDEMGFFFSLFLSPQLACSGTMPCPSSTSSIYCLSRSSRSPRAQRWRVRSSPHQLCTRDDRVGFIHRILTSFPTSPCGTP